MDGARYEELELSDSRLWMPEIDLGLGLWHGDYLGVDRCDNIDPQNRI